MSEEQPQYQGRSLSSWIAQLRDKDKRYRKEAAIALYQIGIEAEPAVPQLIDLFQDGDGEVRAAAIVALSKCGSHAIRALIIASQSKDPQICGTALATLKMIGEPAVPALGKVLADDRKDVRLAIVKMFQELGPKTPATIPFLVEALGDKDSDVGLEAVVALAQIGKPAVPALAIALKKPQSSILAISTLSIIGDDAVPALVEATKDSDLSVRIAAHSALASIRKKRQ